MRPTLVLLITSLLLASPGCTEGRKPKPHLSRGSDDYKEAEEAEETAEVTIAAEEPDPTVLGSIQVTNLTTTKLHASEVDVTDSIKARSIFATRMYSEDVAASGSVSVASLLVKRSARINGEVKILGGVATDDLEASSVVSSKLKATTATISGTLTAGKIETNGIDNVGNEIITLRQRVQQLENVVNKLMGGGDGGTSSISTTSIGTLE
mmetsp:Transcript_14679/g.29676  ORF Transcript_14679/g.29676 Transcript_14679/m.29676 type:complete len:209 (-) Transcript_14679:754-1380(-)